MKKIKIIKASRGLKKEGFQKGEIVPATICSNGSAYFSGKGAYPGHCVVYPENYTLLTIV